MAREVVQGFIKATQMNYEHEVQLFAEPPIIASLHQLEAALAALERNERNKGRFWRLIDSIWDRTESYTLQHAALQALIKAILDIKTHYKNQTLTVEQFKRLVDESIEPPLSQLSWSLRFAIQKRIMETGDQFGLIKKLEGIEQELTALPAQNDVAAIAGNLYVPILNPAGSLALADAQAVLNVIKDIDTRLKTKTIPLAELETLVNAQELQLQVARLPRSLRREVKKFFVDAKVRATTLVDQLQAISNEIKPEKAWLSSTKKRRRAEQDAIAGVTSVIVDMQGHMQNTTLTAENFNAVILEKYLSSDIKTSLAVLQIKISSLPIGVCPSVASFFEAAQAQANGAPAITPANPIPLLDTFSTDSFESTVSNRYNLAIANLQKFIAGKPGLWLRLTTTQANLECEVSAIQQAYDLIQKIKQQHDSKQLTLATYEQLVASYAVSLMYLPKDLQNKLQQALNDIELALFRNFKDFYQTLKITDNSAYEGLDTRMSLELHELTGQLPPALMATLLKRREHFAANVKMTDDNSFNGFVTFSRTQQRAKRMAKGKFYTALVEKIKGNQLTVAVLDETAHAPSVKTSWLSFYSAPLSIISNWLGNLVKSQTAKDGEQLKRHLDSKWLAFIARAQVQVTGDTDNLQANSKPETFKLIGNLMTQLIHLKRAADKKMTALRASKNPSDDENSIAAHEYALLSAICDWQANNGLALGSSGTITALTQQYPKALYNAKILAFVNQLQKEYLRWESAEAYMSARVAKIEEGRAAQATMVSSNMPSISASSQSGVIANPDQGQSSQQIINKFKAASQLPQSIFETIEEDYELVDKEEFEQEENPESSEAIAQAIMSDDSSLSSKEDAASTSALVKPVTEHSDPITEPSELPKELWIKNLVYQFLRSLSGTESEVVDYKSPVDLSDEPYAIDGATSNSFAALPISQRRALKDAFRLIDELEAAHQFSTLTPAAFRLMVVRHPLINGLPRQLVKPFNDTLQAIFQHLTGQWTQVIQELNLECDDSGQLSEAQLQGMSPAFREQLAQAAKFEHSDLLATVMSEKLRLQTEVMKADEHELGRLERSIASQEKSRHEQKLSAYESMIAHRNNLTLPVLQEVIRGKDQIGRSLGSSKTLANINTIKAHMTQKWDAFIHHVFIDQLAPKYFKLRSDMARELVEKLAYYEKQFKKAQEPSQDALQTDKDSYAIKRDKYLLVKYLYQLQTSSVEGLTSVKLEHLEWRYPKAKFATGQSQLAAFFETIREAILQWEAVQYANDPTFKSVLMEQKTAESRLKEIITNILTIARRTRNIHAIDNSDEVNSQIILYLEYQNEINEELRLASTNPNRIESDDQNNLEHALADLISTVTYHLAKLYEHAEKLDEAAAVTEQAEVLHTALDKKLQEITAKVNSLDTVDAVEAEIADIVHELDTRARVKLRRSTSMASGAADSANDAKDIASLKSVEQLLYLRNFVLRFQRAMALDNIKAVETALTKNQDETPQKIKNPLRAKLLSDEKILLSQRLAELKQLIKAELLEQQSKTQATQIQTLTQELALAKKKASATASASSTPLLKGTTHEDLDKGRPQLPHDDLATKADGQEVGGLLVSLQSELEGQKAVNESQTAELQAQRDQISALERQLEELRRNSASTGVGALPLVMDTSASPVGAAPPPPPPPPVFVSNPALVITRKDGASANTSGSKKPKEQQAEGMALTPDMLSGFKFKKRATGNAAEKTEHAADDNANLTAEQREEARNAERAAAMKRAEARLAEKKLTPSTTSNPLTSSLLGSSRFRSFLQQATHDDEQKGTNATDDGWGDSTVEDKASNKKASAAPPPQKRTSVHVKHNTAVSSPLLTTAVPPSPATSKPAIVLRKTGNKPLPQAGHDEQQANADGKPVSIFGARKFGQKTGGK